MSESENTQPFMTVDFGEHGGIFKWMTHNDATQWISDLQSQWQWVGGVGYNVSHIWNKLSTPLSSSLSNIQQALTYRNQGQPQAADAQIASATSILEEHIRNFPWLLPKNPQRNFVEELRDSGKPLESALIVCHWMGVDMSSAPIKQVVSALLQWELYDRGIKDRVKTESAALKRLVGEIQSTLTQYAENERNQSVRFDELHSQITEQFKNQQVIFEATQETRDINWKTQLDVSKGELETLKDTYDQHMALAAPVEYWETKRKKHRLLSIVSLMAVIFGMFAGGCFLHAELKTVGDAITAAKAPSAADVGVKTIETFADAATTWHLGSIILLATLTFWFIRLLVRIFLSNMHLENDAAERVTMAKTYLAMIRDDALPRGENINTVLAALFRPSGDGIVKDEGIPPSTLEWFTKLGR